MVPRLRETRPVARGGQDARIPQPRDHSLADPRIIFDLDTATPALAFSSIRTCGARESFVFENPLAMSSVAEQSIKKGPQLVMFRGGSIPQM